MILVSGATGNVGGELVRQAVEAGQPTRALVRTQEDVIRIPRGAETAIGNLDEPESLLGSLKGVSRVVLLGGFRDMPGLLSAIRASSAHHVVLLSSRSIVGGSSTNAIVKMWTVAEEAVRQSGVSWTILRSSGFMSNALRWLPQMRAGDVIRAPFAGARVAAIDPADIAASALAVLASKSHESSSYTVSGPEALLPSEMIGVLATVLHRPLRFESQSDADARVEMSRSMNADTFDAFFRFFAKGEFDDSSVLPTVHELTGRPPRTFEQWADSHAHMFLS